MTLGFIILRHVNSNLTNNYWKECYDCIRKFYTESHILIVDDNSNLSFITEKELVNTTIIKSEFEGGRGELLPYYYFFKTNLFDTAVILHDSVFIQSYINFNNYKDKFLWTFTNHREDAKREYTLLSILNSNEKLLSIYNQNHWKGCFGAMSIITRNTINIFNEKYNLFILLKHISTRYDRMCFERIISILFWSEELVTLENISILNHIGDYNWGFTFENYSKYKPNFPAIKVWSGR
jgi:hypothetical protein